MDTNRKGVLVGGRDWQWTGYPNGKDAELKRQAKLFYLGQDWEAERAFIKAIIDGYTRMLDDGAALELTVEKDQITIRAVRSAD